MNMPLPSHKETTRFRRIGFLIYPDCEILDFCGPFDAFYYAQRGLLHFGRTSEPDYQCVILAAEPGPIRTKCGIEIVAANSYSDVTDGLDTLIVAGGEGCEQASKDAVLVDWVRSMAPKARRVASVCSGAFILAAAGLLDHRRITTHWMYSQILAAAYPSIQVDSSLIFARDGNIYTSGGITAGIDLALALVEEDLGHEIALLIARTMVVFPRRPGGQSQFSGYFSPDSKVRRDIGELQAWILGHAAADLSVTSLADRMAMSPRNFSRLFRNETGQTPAQFSNAHALMRPVANLSKPACRSRPSPRNAASKIQNACDGHSSAFSTLARPITEPAFDQLCSTKKGRGEASFAFHRH